MSWLQAPLLLTRMRLTGWMAAAVLLALMVGIAGGYRAGSQKAAAEGAAALASLRAQHAAEREINAADYATRVQERTLVAFKLADNLQAERDAHAATRHNLEARISHVTTQYRTSLDAPAQPLPACVFTAGWVRSYDEAIGLPERHATDHPATGFESPPGAADPAEELDSGITQAAVLQHIGAYGQRCHDLESQLNTVLDAVEQQQGDAP